MKSNAKIKEELPYALIALASGLFFGLSAPGWEQWYITWFAMTPLLLLALRSPEPYQAAIRGFLFGTAYNIMYFAWTHDVQDAFWIGSLSNFPMLVKYSTWIVVSIWQGFFVAVFACIIRALPLKVGWLPAKSGKQWLFPSYVAIPLLWCLVVEKLGNMTSLLGVPWSMIQYSQYKQLAILQCASVIGGIGLAALIVLANLILSTVLNSLKPMRFGNWQTDSLFSDDKPRLAIEAVLAVMLLVAIPINGLFALEKEQSCRGRQHLSRVTAGQLRLSEKKLQKVSPEEVEQRFLKLSYMSGPGLLIFPEWMFATNLTEGGFFTKLGATALRNRQSWVAGVLDSKTNAETYHAIVGVREDGKQLSDIYHKNYLVPFCEYIPGWTRDSVIGQLLFFSESINPTPPGETTVVMDLGKHKVGALMSFENLLPELSAKNARNGANILANCTNTTWFENSMLSNQMVSFSVMRAVENHRSVVLSTTLGKSTIINPTGRIVAQAERKEQTTVSAEVPLETEMTIFSRWCY
jgi:apolipoprotein N-acyltransferase